MQCPIRNLLLMNHVLGFLYGANTRSLFSCRRDRGNAEGQLGNSAGGPESACEIDFIAPILPIDKQPSLIATSPTRRTACLRVRPRMAFPSSTFPSHILRTTSAPFPYQ
ncbi:hypothetical protein CEXT_767651 [Caerostris extrusa]|uniref:Uncharacterized protein n=1 Tax=Caerostris extrusa TaxID=172846 RepID=A0AAV4UCV0_CAEEX|nr:hypothetical protein CEXT_767651 [Caerostris extrusa]